MAFVNVDPSFSRDKTEEITKLWQSSLWNSHIQAERYFQSQLLLVIKIFLIQLEFFRYLIDDTRAIFMFKDGSMAWEAKDFLVAQEGCKEVTIENKNYPGLKQVKTCRKIIFLIQVVDYSLKTENVLHTQQSKNLAFSKICVWLIHLKVYPSTDKHFKCHVFAIACSFVCIYYNVIFSKKDIRMTGPRHLSRIVILISCQVCFAKRKYSVLFFEPNVLQFSYGYHI